jgi:hypothetical protein
MGNLTGKAFHGSLYETTPESLPGLQADFEKSLNIFMWQSFDEMSANIQIKLQKEMFFTSWIDGSTEPCSKVCLGPTLRSVCP